MLKPGAWEILVGGCVVLIFGIGIYMGAMITDRRHESNKQTAIKNAIAYCGEPLDCNTAQALKALEGMAMNRYKMDYHQLCWTSDEEGQ